MAVTWQLGFVLPNFQVPLTATDLSGFMALASYRDVRVTNIRQNQRGTDKFLDGFRDVYDARQQPGAVIWRNDICQDRVSLKTFVDFRNIVALAAILPGWAGLDPRQPVTPSNPLWSDTFDFHPGRLNTQGAIEIYNPAQNVFSSHNTPFVGMPSPHIPVYKDPFAPDWPLLAKLLRVWELRYLRAHTSVKEHEPLFRSLEMAYRALQVPIHNEGTIQDFGTSLGLWVSAFEILAHPSQRKVQLTDVLDLLARAKWVEPRLRHRRFIVKYRKQRLSATFAERVYPAIYSSRNTFLHGNPIYVKDWKFTHRTIKMSIGNLAPLIYRTALMCHLEGWNIDRRLVQRMAGVVTYHKDWQPEFHLDDVVIACTNQKYEDALLRLLPS